MRKSVVASRKVERPIQYPGTRDIESHQYRSRRVNKSGYRGLLSRSRRLPTTPRSRSRERFCRPDGASRFDTNVIRVAVIKGSGRLDKEEEATAVRERPGEARRQVEEERKRPDAVCSEWHSLSVDPRRLSRGLPRDIIMCTCPCITDYLTDRARVCTGERTVG